MRYAATALFLALPLVPATAAEKHAISPTGHSLSPDCKAPGATQVREDKPVKGLHKLGDEPPASQLLAVYREAGGCPAPIVLREGIGANPGTSRPVDTTPPALTHVQ